MAGPATSPPVHKHGVISGLRELRAAGAAPADIRRIVGLP